MSKDLHQDRLATTDEKGHRIFLFPHEVKGHFRKLRTKIYWALIVIFLVLPWINVGGKQSILLDIPKREFTFFGVTFLGHDTPLLFLVLATLAFLIAAITAIFGRVWCGWACPQTVYIDAVYRKIEELIEGKARQRQELDRAPWTANKFAKRAIKWALYTLISVHLAHSFLGYFVGIRSLFAITLSPPAEHWPAFVTMLVTSAILLFNFGWFREQFCIIACPYGRFQSVMMDTQSLVVAYDTKRGEPRRTVAKSPQEEGDCINCAKCVKVCPTGIDIRRGTQLECIACTACIDACDEIMLKVGKPVGLIRYTSEEIMQGGRFSLKRLRPLLYFSILIILTTTFVTLVSNRADVGAVYVRGTGAPYQILQQDGVEIIANYYKVEITHREHNELEADFKILSPTDRDFQIISAKRPFLLKKGKQSVGLFIRTKAQNFVKGNINLTIAIVRSEGEKEEILNSQEIHLVGP